tara:strand:+ start:15309 stop:16748 length:1440 start_codon:yes stop_codon:yes gene_type:complete
MKYTLIILALLCAHTAFGQESVLSFKNLDFKTQLRNVENYSLSDSRTNNVAVILAQKKKIQGYLFNSDFKKIGEASGTHLKKKYKEVIGYSIENEKRYTLVFSTSSNKKFGYISLDLESGEIKTDEIEFKFEGEKYLETVSFENRMILMSATKKNALILREFTPNFTFKTIATFQLDSDDKEQQLLKSIGFFSVEGGMTKIDNRVPNTIDRSSKENKLYHKDDKLYLTFEDDDIQTILHIIDLSSLSLTTKTFEYPEGWTSEFKNYNSFIHGENLFHIASSKDEMIFQVKNFDNEVIKEYHADQISDIEFKNSPIIQDGSAYRKAKRELKTTKQFLRKITSGDIGVSIHKEDGNYQITLGSYAMISSGGGGFSGVPMGPMGGTTIPVGGGQTLYVPSYNPTFSSFNGYGFSKAVYINGLFDSDFNHIKNEEFQDNIFDRVKEYQEDLKWDTAEDIFIHNDNTYFSYWNTKEREYRLLKF